MNKSRTLIQNTLYISISKLITEIIGIFVQILIIRKLTVETYGEFNFLLNSFIIFQIFSISPIADVFYRYIAELSEKYDYNRLYKLIIYGTFISLLSFIILLLILNNFKYDLIKIFLISDLNQYYWYYVIFLCSFYLSSFTSLITASLLLHKYLGIIRIITSFIRSVLYYIYLSNLTVSKLIIIESIVSFIIFIYLTIIITMNLVKKENVCTSPFFNGKKRILRFGLFSSLNELGTGIIGTSSDYFIISAIGDPISVGLYAFAHKIYGIIFKILPMKDLFSVIRTVFFQKYSNNISKSEINLYYNIMVKAMLPIYILPFLIFSIFGKSIIMYIFDPKYISSFYTTCIVLLSLVTIAVFYPLGIVVQLYEKTEYGFYSRIVAIFSIISGIYFMKIWGITGVATATLIGETLRNVLMLIFISRCIKIKYEIKGIFKWLFPIGILYISFLLINNIVNNIIVLIIFIFLFLSLYVLLLIFYNPFNDKELLVINNIINNSKALIIIKNVVLKINNVKKVIQYDFK